MLLTSLLSAALASTPAWPDLSEPPSVGGGSQDAAIIVSIEDYVFVDDITGAQANGLDWYSYLTDGRGIPASRVTLLENQRATREAIEDAIAESRERVSKGGTLWFIFIGHGAPSRDGTDGLLLGADTQPTAASVYARGLPQSTLLSELGQGKQADTVVLLDACFSGQSSDGALVDGLMPLVPDYGTDKSNAIVLSAGKGDEFAGPLPGADRPAFSYLALGALRGWGDVDGNGRVTAQEVSDYARGALQAMPLDRKQTPQLSAPAPDTVLGAGQESGPSLSKLRRSLSAAASTASEGIDGATTVDGGSALAAQLAEMKRLQEQQAQLQAEQDRLQAQVAQEVSARRATVQAEATALWDETKGITGSMKPQALQMFIDAYADAHVTVGDERFPVPVAEVATAQLKLGGLYRDGTHVTQDFGRAVALYAAACDQNEAIACNNLSYRYKKGEGTAKDMARATALLEKSCGLDYGPACRTAAQNHRNGDGIPADPYKAFSLYEQGCDLDDGSSCNSLGWYGYHEGSGATQSDSRALELFQKACDLDSGAGCTNAGDFYYDGNGTPQDYAKAIPLYEKACELQYSTGCNQLGANIYYDGNGAPQSYPRALEMFSEACDLDNGVSCRNAASIYRKGLGMAVDERQATAFYQKGCDLDEAKSCNWLGFQHSNGKGVVEDKNAALRFYEKACTLGNDQACQSAQYLKENGVRP